MKKIIFFLAFSLLIMAGCNQSQSTESDNHNTDPINNDNGQNHHDHEDEEHRLEHDDEEHHHDTDVLLTDVFSNMEELVSITPVVVRASVTTDPEEIEFSYAYFYTSTLQIHEIFRDEYGELEKDLKVTLLQNGNDYDPLVTKGEELLLFLLKYEGPIVEDAYRLVGLGEGQLLIDNGTLSVAKESYSIVASDVNEMSISDIIEIIENNPYSNPYE